MSLAETLANHHRAVEGIKDGAIKVHNGALMQAEIAKGGTINAEGRRTTDVTRLGISIAVQDVSGSVYLAARMYQTEYVIPARGISSALGTLQNVYAEYLDHKNSDSRQLLTKAVQGVEATVHHFSRVKERKAGILAEDHLPQLLNAAQKSVHARLALQEERRRLESERLPQRGMIRAEDVKTGTVTTIDPRSVITPDRPKLSLKDIILSKLKF